MQESLLDMLARTTLPPGSPDLPFAALGGLLAYLICLAFFFRKKSPFQNLCAAALFAYAAVLLAAAQCLPPPSSLSWDRASAVRALAAVEWNPLRQAALGSDGVAQRLVRNFAALMPVGLLAPLAGLGFRPKRLAALAVLCGFGLEALQFLCNVLTRDPARVVRPDDAVLQAAGCLLVSLALAGIKKLASPKHAAKHYANSHG